MVLYIRARSNLEDVNIGIGYRKNCFYQVEWVQMAATQRQRRTPLPDLNAFINGVRIRKKDFIITDG